MRRWVVKTKTMQIRHQTVTSKCTLLVPIMIETGVQCRYVLAQRFPVCVHIFTNNRV